MPFDILEKENFMKMLNDFNTEDEKTNINLKKKRLLEINQLKFNFENWFLKHASIIETCNIDIKELSKYLQVISKLDLELMNNLLEIKKILRLENS